MYRKSFTFILRLCQARVDLFIKFRVAVCKLRVLCFDSSTYNFTSGNFIFFLDFGGWQVLKRFSLLWGLLLIKHRVHLPFLRKLHALLNSAVLTCKILRRLHF